MRREGEGPGPTDQLGRCDFFLPFLSGPAALVLPSSPSPVPLAEVVGAVDELAAGGDAATWMSFVGGERDVLALGGIVAVRAGLAAVRTAGEARTRRTTRR